MTKTELKNILGNILDSQEDKKALMDTLSSIVVAMGDRDHLLGGEMERTFKHGRLSITIRLDKGKK
jgi:hypothetical protein